MLLIINDNDKNICCSNFISLEFCRCCRHRAKINPKKVRVNQSNEWIRSINIRLSICFGLFDFEAKLFNTHMQTHWIFFLFAAVQTKKKS